MLSLSFTVCANNRLGIGSASVKKVFETGTIESSQKVLVDKSMMATVTGAGIGVVACFYLVFNGANIMLDLLGMRDGGFDVGGIIGDKVESKHNKLNQGI